VEDARLSVTADSDVFDAGTSILDISTIGELGMSAATSGGSTPRILARLKIYNLSSIQKCLDESSCISAHAYIICTAFHAPANLNGCAVFYPFRQQFPPQIFYDKSSK
jgi:hypothetical protein